MNGVMVVLFEAASVLFVPMITGIFFIWNTIVDRSVKLKTIEKGIRIPLPFWISFAVVIVSTIVFAIVFYLIPEQATLPCRTELSITLHHNKILTNLGYVIFMALLSLVPVIIYPPMGIIFLVRSHYHNTVKRATISVLTTFVPMFAIKSILTLWSAVTGGVVPVLVYCGLDVVPIFVLEYYVYPILLCGDSGNPSNNRNTTKSSSLKSPTSRFSSNIAPTTFSDKQSLPPRSSISVNSASSVSVSSNSSSSNRDDDDK
jgi:hypothetical protein